MNNIIDSDPKGPNNLLYIESVERYNQVSDVKYDFHISLTKGAEQYKGDITITFNFKLDPNAKELFFDFVGKTIESIKINGVSVSGNIWRSNRLYIGSFLKAGNNEVKVVYLNNYDHSGDGFHQFIDPEDKQEYLYTNFEPFECHRLIPCFDQPNIKGVFSVSVEAPSDWKVIANSKIKCENEKGDSTLHVFIPTPKISTYLFAIVAGPYDRFEDTYDNRVPLGIFVRKSLKKYLDVDNIFTQSKQGMKFYEEFFDLKYPFDKYDQLFVPEFNVGAMENVGCVTFTESYVFKTSPTRSQQANRADTILHEMAHMWFGNLVTPVWWDGLWLNESFATYMAALCVASATEFGELSWQNFNSTMKQWAYREDQLSTTHPIQGEVPDTVSTQLIFDGITYGKGASLLKQLVHVVGMDSFKSGMRYYFKQYAWGNTTIAQFLEALASVTNKLDARAWSSEWLETSGLNTLQLNIQSENGKITSAIIEQTAPTAHPILRNHAMEIVMFNLDKGELKLEEKYNFSVKAQPNTPLENLVGKNVPTFMYINFNDHAFAKCPLDKQSFAFVLENLELISNPLLRQLLWTSFYDLTRDAIMKSTDYLDLVSTKIGIESDPKLVQTVLSRAFAALIHFVPKSLVDTYSEKLFNSVFALLKKAQVEEFKLVWARSTTDFARTENSVKILADELRKENPAYTQDLRWSILIKMVAWAIPDAHELLSKEQEKDKSDTGLRAVLRANTSVPKLDVKEKAWERFLNPETKLSTHQSAAEMAGFRWSHQESLLNSFTEKFFVVIRTVFKDREKEFANSFFYHLFPSDPENPQIMARAKQILGELTPDEKHLSRILKEEIDDLEREIRCRNVVLRN